MAQFPWASVIGGLNLSKKAFGKIEAFLLKNQRDWASILDFIPILISQLYPSIYIIYIYVYQVIMLSN